jgi:phage antirepressor YoqD-like protein
MGAVSNAVAACRRAAILADVNAGQLSVKEIAFKNQCSLQTVRMTLWTANWRAMLVTPAERAAILAQRRAGLNAKRTGTGA